MFTPGTLVNIPHFRGKALLVVGNEAQHTLCLWTSDTGEMGEVLVPTALLREIQPPPAPPAADLSAALSSDETLPGDWFRKAPPGTSR